MNYAFNFMSPRAAAVPRRSGEHWNGVRPVCQSLEVSLAASKSTATTDGLVAGYVSSPDVRVTPSFGASVRVSCLNL